VTGLEQFHQGKSHDETHRSPLEASQSQVHRSEGSADDRPAQAQCCNLSCRLARASYARAAHSFIRTPRTIGQHDPSRMLPAATVLTEYIKLAKNRLWLRYFVPHRPMSRTL
jgi:hypothetical protein